MPTDGAKLRLGFQFFALPLLSPSSEEFEVPSKSSKVKTVKLIFSVSATPTRIYQS